MIYVHSLKDLNQKTADIESIYIIREIKEKNQVPIIEENLRNHISPFFVSNEDITIMKNSLDLIGPTIQKIRDLSKIQDIEYEPINIHRAISMLEEIFIPLLNNIYYFEDIFTWQEQASNEITNILNSIPTSKSNEEKLKINKELSETFEKILRNKEFRFNYNGIINDGLLERIKNLNESMENGFLFHVTLEEHLNKVNFDVIRKRISSHKLEIAENIAQDIIKIKKGVELVYKKNMHIINIALILYAYIKWLKK